MSETTTHSVHETEHFAYTYAKSVQAGATICLRGALGAGKTAFVKGFAHGKGFPPEDVSSPTFEIIHEYRGGELPLFHFDFYRVETPEEAAETGFEDYLYKGGICLIEWPDVVLPFLGNYTEISIEGDADYRVIKINDRQ